MKRFKKIEVDSCYAKEGLEIEHRGCLWTVKAILGQKVYGDSGGGVIMNIVLIEYVCTVIERLQNDIYDLKQKVGTNKKYKVETRIKRHDNSFDTHGYMFERIDIRVSHPIVVRYHQDTNESEFYANCPVCGALVYTAKHPRIFKEVFPVERPFCQHCGSKLNASDVELDISKYTTKEAEK